jgi:uridine kinase
MRYRKWLRKIERDWKMFGKNVHKTFPNYDFRRDYENGYEWQVVSAKLTKFVPCW